VAAAALALLVAGGGPRPAAGERLDRDESARSTSVMNRPRPDYDPLCVIPDYEPGYQPGPPLLLCPRVNIETAYTDNAFFSADDPEGSFVTTVLPRLSLATDWPNHKLELLLTGEIGRFANAPSNNYEDGTAQLSGRLDLTERLEARAELGTARQHEPRGDPDSAPPGTDVNVFQSSRARLSTQYQPGDIFFGADVGAERLDYQDNGPILNDDRDRTVYAGGLRAGYRLSEETRAFVATEANARRYDQTRDRQGFLQDSQGWSASLGAIYDVSSLTYLEADLGYFQQTYEDPAFDATSGIAAGLDLTWNATDLMTVTASLDRLVDETTVGGASGILRTSAGLGVDYEFDYNLIGRASVDYARSDFEGVARSDDTVRGDLAVSYLLNRYLWFDASYTLFERSSDVAANEYTVNRVMFTIRAQY
jgi:hypothetical protein